MKSDYSTVFYDLNLVTSVYGIQKLIYQIINLDEVITAILPRRGLLMYIRGQDKNNCPQGDCCGQLENGGLKNAWNKTGNGKAGAERKQIPKECV